MAKATSTKELAKDPMVSLFRRRKLIITLIVLFLLLAVTIGLVTYYGLSTGGFTINVDDELSGMGIVLKGDENGVNGDGERSINAPELSEVNPISQVEINEYLALNSDGGYKSDAGNYIGYTFYLANVGSKKCDIKTTFKVIENTRDVAAAARFWVFISKGTEEEKDGSKIFKATEEDTTGTIYKKTESTKERHDSYIIDTCGWGGYSAKTKLTAEEYTDQKTVIEENNYFVTQNGEDYYTYDYSVPTVNWNTSEESYDDTHVRNWAEGVSSKDNIILEKKFLDFNPGEDYKITILMWLDGNDPDCEAYYGENGERVGIIEGKLKVGMSFEAYHDSIL